jgi:hypothetical protein
MDTMDIRVGRLAEEAGGLKERIDAGDNTMEYVLNNLERLERSRVLTAEHIQKVSQHQNLGGLLPEGLLNVVGDPEPLYHLPESRMNELSALLNALNSPVEPGSLSLGKTLLQWSSTLADEVPPEGSVPGTVYFPVPFQTGATPYVLVTPVVENRFMAGGTVNVFLFDVGSHGFSYRLSLLSNLGVDLGTVKRPIRFAWLAVGPSEPRPVIVEQTN